MIKWQNYFKSFCHQIILPLALGFYPEFDSVNRLIKDRQMRTTKRFLILIAAAFVGCVGTDLIEEPVLFIPARIAITPASSAVEVGRTTSFQATYYDSLGNAVPAIMFQWSSSDTIVASINADGLVFGKQAGQTMIIANARRVTSNAAMLTVVADPNQVAQVTVSPDSGKISAGATFQLNAAARNLLGNALSGKTFSWRSSDATIASINSSGLATGIKPGEVNIIATADGIDSPAAHLTILGASRSGVFTRRPGTSYNVSGAATLEQQPDGSLVLKLGNDFSSSSGPGLEVYLSTTNAVGAGSISLGRLQRTSGAQSYNVPSSVALTTYNWVMIHCVPFNVTFGYAQLQ
jgi:hypothetical protein